MRIGVVTGGQSAEQEVSLSTAHEIGAALQRLGFQTVQCELGPELPRQLATSGVDVLAVQHAGGPQSRGK